MSEPKAITIEQREKEMQNQTMQEDAVRNLLFGKFEPIEKMSAEQIKEELKMWRNLWSWVPSAIKYYISRIGTLAGVTIRNYHRYVGILLDTHWELREIELGVYEKVYDQNSGEYYYERKVVKIPISQIIALDWIAERIPAHELEKEETQA